MIYIYLNQLMTLRSTIFFLLLFFSARSLGQLEYKVKEIDSLLRHIYKDDVPGISISITQNGKSIFKNSYGVADLETQKNLDSKTDFNIGSLTKQFTALAILQLAGSNKLSLDDRLGKFFPALNKKVAETLTVKELLTHSSGIIDHYDLSDTRNMKH